MTAIRRCVLGAALSLVVSSSFMGPAQADIVENPDGSVAVTVDGDVVSISASVAAAVIEVLNENVGDIERLRSAIEALVSESAGEPNDQLLARALAVFAVSRSGGDSAVVATIVGGVAAGQPALSVADVLDVLPAVADVDAEQQPVTRQPVPRTPTPRTDARNTAENPQQLSPT